MECNKNLKGKGYLVHSITPRQRATVAARPSVGGDHCLGTLRGLGRKIVIRSETGEQHSEGEGANNDLHGVLPFKVGSSMSAKVG